MIHLLGLALAKSAKSIIYKKSIDSSTAYATVNSHDESTREKNSDRRFSFIPVSGDLSAAKEVTVLVHGYNAAPDFADKVELAKIIKSQARRLDHPTLIAFWDSGKFLELEAFTSATGSAPLMTSGFFIAGGAYAIGGFTTDRIKHFRKFRGLADENGATLEQELISYFEKKGLAVDTVNLIGHSLGGRLVLSFLRNNTSLKVGDVLLMAAAAPKPGTEDLSRIKARIGRRFISAYSSADRILSFNFDEKCIGSCATPGITSIHMKGYGHTDYWPKLDGILEKCGLVSNRDRANNPLPPWGYRVHGSIKW